MALWNATNVLTTEDRLTKQTNNDYERALASAWWDELVVERTSTGRRDVFEWLLTTAQIHKVDKGSIRFDDLVTQTHEIVHDKFAGGIRISQDQFEDDEFGFAAEQAADLGSASALLPQKLTVDLILGGGTKKGYDGVSFFNASHPVNPFDTSKGTYSNSLTSTALTAANFSDAVGKMSSFVMPNGEVRNLQVTHLIVPPALRKTALEITSAEFLGQASGGTNDNVLRSYGVKALVIPQISAAGGGSDTTWYLAATMGSSFSKPFIYSVRKPFQMTTYDGITQAQLSRMSELEWHLKGRSAAAYGHPFLMMKCAA